MKSPAHPNSNADVENSHATIRPEFFDLETFADSDRFHVAVITYQHLFNFARKNRSRHILPPASLLAFRAPHPSLEILLLPPHLIRAEVGRDMSAAPMKARHAGQGLLYLNFDFRISTADG